MPEDGRVITPAIRAGFLVPLALASAWTALVTIGLSGSTEAFFAWTAGSRLSAATIGAGYLAGLAMFVVALRLRRWVDIRSTVLSAMLLLGLALTVTLVHRNDFHLGGGELFGFFAAWGWLLVHVFGLLLGLILLLWQLRAGGAKAPHPERAPWWTAVPVGSVGVIGVGLGAVALLAPQRVSPYWPWEVNPLDLRVMAVWTLTFGAGSWLALWEADPERQRVGSVGYLFAGLGTVAVLLIHSGEVRWGTVSTWLYLLAMLGLAGLGAAGWFLAGPPDRWVRPPLTP